MKIIRPTVITDAILTASTVAEADYPAWSAATAYAIDARCILAATHRIYASLVANNTAHDPSTSPTYWQDIGPTNRWAMFDDSVGSLTRQAGGIAVTLAPGGADALAVLDVDAEAVTVVMAAGGTEIYRRTQYTNAGGVAITDWLLYLTAPAGVVTSLTFMDLPAYPTASVSVSITSSDPAKVVATGTMIVGRQMDLGSAAAGAEVGILDFSRKETDVFGLTSVVERAFAKRLTVRVLTSTAQIDVIQRTLALLRAQPLLWIAAEGYDALTVYGFYKEFSIDVAYANISYASLTIEGLI